MEIIIQVMSADGELSNLGRTIKAYRGHITRLINELEPHFSEQFASDEVVERHSSLVSIFEKLKRASSEWFHLTEGSADRERISEDYAKDVFRMKVFENKYKEWLDRVYTPRRREVYGEGILHTSGIDLSSKMPAGANTEVSHVKNDSEVSGLKPSNLIQNTSIQDTAPVQTRSREMNLPQGSEACARDVKRAMAQLKVRELQEIQAIKEREIELRLQEESTRLLPERERLQLRSQLMQARIDAERAKLEAAFGDQVGYSSVISAAGSVRVHENVERYLTGLPSVIPGQPFEGERVIPETGKYTLPEVKVDPSELKFLSGRATHHDVSTFPRDLRKSGKGSCHGEDVNPDNTVNKLEKFVQRQQTAIDKVVLGLEKLDMPKREFLYFDGDPSRYPRFIKNFELHVESTIEDDNVRLSYLIQYCRGKAKEAIENCTFFARV